MPRGRSPGSDGQREAILAPAAVLFSRRGYPATSMNEVAEASGLSKATLYHYFRDKYELLVHITDGHVSHLQALVAEVEAMTLPPEKRLRLLISRFVEAYADAQHAHRVLTEDVRFLNEADSARVLGKERDVVAGMARAVAAVRPELHAAHLEKPLTMLLFGMINWLFTWMKPGGALGYEAMAPIVTELFLGGLPAVPVPQGAAPAEPAAATAVPQRMQEPAKH